MGYDLAFAAEREMMKGKKHPSLALSHLKTIYDVKNSSRQFIKKVIDLESETFKRDHPGYELTDIKVHSQTQGSITYKMIFTVKGAMTDAATD